MDNNTRHATSSAEPRNWDASNVQQFSYPNPSVETAYSTMNMAAKLAELNNKIGRRYSFDDNGGGYEGL